jgi:2-C-methyl-D-erythritol 4-phosphate cytidylyltransferase
MMTNPEPRFWAVVPAAGVGSRMAASCPKQYLQLADKTVIEQTLSTLLSEERLETIAVAISADDSYWESFEKRLPSRVQTVEGGKERADSVLSGLKFLAEQADDNDWVLVHDAARPCVSQDEICRLIDQLQDDSVGGILALPLHDTLKQADNGLIEKTIDRQKIWRALTPQLFRFGLLKKALETALETGAAVTDEASAIELLGYHPKLVVGEPRNIKITRPADLYLAAFYLENTA